MEQKLLLRIRELARRHVGWGRRLRLEGWTLNHTCTVAVAAVAMCVLVASHARPHGELIAFLRQHCPLWDQRHLVLLDWMMAGLLLSQTVCFEHWKTRLPLGYCPASSWQRRCQRRLWNSRIDAVGLYEPVACRTTSSISQTPLNPPRSY